MAIYSVFFPNLAQSDMDESREPVFHQKSVNLLHSANRMRNYEGRSTAKNSLICIAEGKRKLQKPYRNRFKGKRGVEDVLISGEVKKSEYVTMFRRHLGTSDTDTSSLLAAVVAVVIVVVVVVVV